MMTCQGEGYIGEKKDDNSWVGLIIIAVVAFALGTGLFCVAKHIRNRNEAIDEENKKAKASEMAKITKPGKV